jgi:hypothetical protein
MDCKENDCETIDDLGVYTYILEAFRKLWTQVNVTGFQTFSPDSKIIVGPLPNATIITPSSVSTQNIIITNPSNINQSITLTYDNEFSDLQTQLYQLITMMTTFGSSPNMQALNAAYQTFISAIQSNYDNDYQDLPWVYNPANISSSLLFYQPNFTSPSYLWTFFNSLLFTQSINTSWYSLTSLSVAPYNNYTVPTTPSTVSTTVSGNSPQVFNIFFYNEGRNYVSSTATSNTNTNTTYTYAGGGTAVGTTPTSVYRSSGSYGVCGISTPTALTTGSPVYGTTVSITGIAGSSGARGAISLGVVFSTTDTFPSTTSTKYVSAQFTTVTGNIKDLLGSNASNSNCFAYYDPTYVATNSTGYRPLDIWSFSATQTISNSNIIYEYIGIVLQSSTPVITISGNNILFRNCVFNIKGNSTNTFKITGSNVVFDRCIFRNPVSNETVNLLASPPSTTPTNSSTAPCIITEATIMMLTEFLTASSSFYFVNNYINFNVNDAYYLYNISSSNSTNTLRNVISLTTATATSSTQAQNCFICNNTIESSWFANAFASTPTGIMAVQSTIFSSNNGIVSIYYQLNTHLASNNYIIDRRVKDFPDLYIAVLNSNKTNVSIYFLDLYANEGSNFLKLLINYASGPQPSGRTSTTPFLYYDIQ